MRARLSLVTLLAAGLAACGDSPVAPTATTADRLTAVADSADAAGDPIGPWLRGAAVMLDGAPKTQRVTIVVDGVPQSFEAVVVESVTPVPVQFCTTPGTSVCDAGAATTIDTRSLLAWDETMRHFVNVSVSSFGVDAVPNSLGVYAERGIRPQPGTTFMGEATARPALVSTGAACPGRRDAGPRAPVASCVTAVYDFAFEFSATPLTLIALPGAPPGPIGPPIGPVHTLRMATTRLPGTYLTFQPFAGELPFLP